MIPPSFIQDLLARIDIVEIVNARVSNLRKAGSNNFQTLCPFHNEKTPSFNVNQRKQFYHCFGCGAHGNAISFLMEFEKLNFIEAIETLAAHAGLEIPRTTDRDSSPEHKEQQTQLAAIYSLLEKVNSFYQQQLVKSQPAINYLKQRGLSYEVCSRFQIGYSPQGWENLTQLHTNNSQLKQQLLTAGMLLQKDGARSNEPQQNENTSAHKTYGGFYARFRNRIMFPIRDRRGRIIGFGGRTMGDDTPKYLNSPETPLFHKGSELYGLYEARQSNHQLVYIIVVEGYMDVISLAQYGITNVVATLGTAITPKQTQLLLQNCATIIFCFDGDNAGKSAAWRALENILPLMRAGVETKFMFLPEKEDPDSMVRKEGRDAFLQRLTTTALPLSDFLFQHLSSNIDLNSLDGRAKLIQETKKLLARMANGVFKQLLFNRLAEITKTDVDTILRTEQLDAATKTQFTVTPKTLHEKASAKNTIGNTTSTVLSLNPVQMAIGLLLNFPELVTAVSKEDITAFSVLNRPETNLLLRLSNLLQKQQYQQQKPTLGAILEHWRQREELEEEYALITKIALWEPVISHPALKNEFDGIIHRIREQELEHVVHLLFQKAKTQEISVEEKQKLQKLIQLMKSKKS